MQAIYFLTLKERKGKQEVCLKVTKKQVCVAISCYTIGAEASTTAKFFRMFVQVGQTFQANLSELALRDIYFSESVNFFPTYFTASLNFFPIT